MQHVVLALASVLTASLTLFKVLQGPNLILAQLLPRHLQFMLHQPPPLLPVQQWRFVRQHALAQRVIAVAHCRPTAAALPWQRIIKGAVRNTPLQCH